MLMINYIRIEWICMETHNENSINFWWFPAVTKMLLNTNICLLFAAVRADEVNKVANSDCQFQQKILVDYLNFTLFLLHFLSVNFVSIYDLTHHGFCLKSETLADRNTKLVKFDYLVRWLNTILFVNWRTGKLQL